MKGQATDEEKVIVNFISNKKDFYPEYIKISQVSTVSQVITQ